MSKIQGPVIPQQLIDLANKGKAKADKLLARVKHRGRNIEAKQGDAQLPTNSTNTQYLEGLKNRSGKVYSGSDNTSGFSPEDRRESEMTVAQQAKTATREHKRKRKSGERPDLGGNKGAFAAELREGRSKIGQERKNLEYGKFSSKGAIDRHMKDDEARQAMFAELTAPTAKNATRMSHQGDQQEWVSTRTMDSALEADETRRAVLEGVKGKGVDQRDQDAFDRLDTKRNDRLMEHVLLDQFVVEQDDVIALGEELLTLDACVNHKELNKLNSEISRMEEQAAQMPTETRAAILTNIGNLKEERDEVLEPILAATGYESFEELQDAYKAKTHELNDLQSSKLRPRLETVQKNSAECRALLSANTVSPSDVVAAGRELTGLRARLEAAEDDPTVFKDKAELKATFKRASQLMKVIEHGRMVMAAEERLAVLSRQERALDRLISGFDSDEEVQTAKHLGVSEKALAQLAFSVETTRGDLKANEQMILVSLRKANFGSMVRHMVKAMKLRRQLKNAKKDMRVMAGIVQAYAKKLGIAESNMTVQIQGKNVTLSTELKWLYQRGMEALPVYHRHGEGDFTVDLLKTLNGAVINQQQLDTKERMMEELKISGAMVNYDGDPDPVRDQGYDFMMDLEDKVDRSYQAGVDDPDPVRDQGYDFMMGLEDKVAQNGPVDKDDPDYDLLLEESYDWMMRLEDEIEKNGPTSGSDKLKKSLDVMKYYEQLGHEAAQKVHQQQGFGSVLNEIRAGNKVPGNKTQEQYKEQFGAVLKDIPAASNRMDLFRMSGSLDIEDRGIAAAKKKLAQESQPKSKAPSEHELKLRQEAKERWAETKAQGRKQLSDEARARQEAEARQYHIDRQSEFQTEHKKNFGKVMDENTYEDFEVNDEDGETYGYGQAEIPEQSINQPKPKQD
ncbi:hypothetical protein [Parendozoicomonas haliclonae]|uniref:Uncharacterized protein n=1 Tax=Parendozoicomonas haliclonae TaxID=1960125 RepID=A0A1X7AP63_9GAMM|nr:hypothetical protein [Parendozoicomonas haliclonae]SMA50111.1 hypothetical protein EHSB41UT_03902 [Parendozoicomonas haliclonae]